MYQKGQGVEKDLKKALYHLEEAAIGGHPYARYNLGHFEEETGGYERAVKHYIIGANLGDDDSMQQLKEVYKDELVSEEDFASVLRAHHAAVDAMKSQQRDEAADAFAAARKIRADD